MVPRLSRLMQSFSVASRSLGLAAVLTAGLLSIGCGSYEPEPEYPQQYQYAAPTPLTADQLAAQQAAHQQAAAESREVLVGADGDDEYSDTDPSALSEFKPTLDSHGTWVSDASYGTVWVPAREEVGADFQPYVTAGHWTYSEATDYVWVSDYSWGWAPFHYGRWVHVSNHGWAWIPGRRYSGAWVTWRTGPTGYGYVGWAPAPPSWYWYNGVAYGWSFGWYHHHDHYVYCPQSHVYHHQVGSYVARGPAARDQHYGRTQDYTPARPSVGGGDRVVASPSVGGSERVVANPTVNGNRVVANPGVRGPRPDEIGVKNDLVVAPPSSDQGINRAQTFATPRTAIAAGAAAPAHLRPRATDSMGPTQRGPASAANIPTASSPTMTQPPSRSFAGSSSPSLPPSATYRATPSYNPSPSPTPSYGSSTSPTFRSTPSPVVRSSPSFGSSTPSPTFRSSPSPVVRSSPSFGSSSPSPTFRSSPSPVVRSSPSFGSSSPTFRSSPSPVVRSSPSPSFRSSSPTVRSSPSVSAPSRSMSPSRSSSPTVRRR